MFYISGLLNIEHIQASYTKIGLKYVKTARFFIKTSCFFDKSNYKGLFRPGCRDTGGPGVGDVKIRISVKPE